MTTTCSASASPPTASPPRPASTCPIAGVVLAVQPARDRAGVPGGGCAPSQARADPARALGRRDARDIQAHVPGRGGQAACSCRPWRLLAAHEDIWERAAPTRGRGASPGGHRARVQGQVPRQLASHVPGSRPDANRGALRLTKHVHQGWDDRPHHRERQPRAHGVLLSLLPDSSAPESSTARRRRTSSSPSRRRSETEGRPRWTRTCTTGGTPSRTWTARKDPTSRACTPSARPSRGSPATAARPPLHMWLRLRSTHRREQLAGFRQARERGRVRAGAGADGGGVEGIDDPEMALQEIVRHKREALRGPRESARAVQGLNTMVFVPWEDVHDHVLNHGTDKMDFS